MEDKSEKAFLDNIVTHQAIIVKVCRIYKQDQEDREDLSQEIIYNAWRSYSRFENRSKFSTWLYRVALNTALYEKRRNRISSKFVDLELASNVHSEELNEKNELLYVAINRLNAIEKSIVILYLEELPYKEISEITGLTESNIGVKLNRIKTKIRKILSDYGT